MSLFFIEDYPSHPKQMVLSAIEFFAPTPTAEDQKAFRARAIQKFGQPDPKLAFNGFAFSSRRQPQPNAPQFGYTSANCLGSYNRDCNVTPLDVFDAGPSPSSALMFTVSIGTTSSIIAYDGPAISRARVALTKAENAISTSATSF